MGARYTWAQDFDMPAWLAAWEAGIAAQWPGKRPDDVEDLLRVRGSLPFAPPEGMPTHAARAWEVYEADDRYQDLHEASGCCSPVGRAAVALAYIIAASVRKVES